MKTIRERFDEEPLNGKGPLELVAFHNGADLMLSLILEALRREDASNFTLNYYEENKTKPGALKWADWIEKKAKE